MMRKAPGVIPGAFVLLSRITKRNFYSFDKIGDYRFIHMGIDAKHGIVFSQAFIGSEYPIPDAEYVSVVAIGIGELEMMMNMVDIRRDKKQPDKPLGFWRQSEACM